jgi:hypothetical protein
MSKDLTREQLIEFFEINYNYYIKCCEFKKNNNIKIRLPNFPEGLSENIVKFL